MFKTSFLASLVAIGTMVFISSCTKTETKTNLAAPTLSLSKTTVSNIIGATVTTAVTVDAPEGGATLTATVNGVADASFGTSGTLTLDGTTNQTVTYSYTIPSTASVGDVKTVVFQATDKKSQNSSSAIYTVTVSSVPDKPTKDIGTDGGSYYITANRTFSADTIYILHGFVRVGADFARTASGVGATAAQTSKHVAVNANGGLEVTDVTLTIEPGTVVYGALGTPGGTLIIQRGNKLNAVGTASNPIVFTSAAEPNARKAGDWGGIVICGRASNNITSSATDGGGASLQVVAGLGELEGGYAGFHGGKAADIIENDNSGDIEYVRAEYAGYPIQPNQELNEFTFGSVGSGTIFSYVQASYSNDDSFEWFGGSMNADHIIAYKGLDDDFDTDNGFHGHVQFGLDIRDLNIADQSGSNAFESDNDAAGSYAGTNLNGSGSVASGYNSVISSTPIYTNGSYTGMPYTIATFSNITVIGAKQAYNTAINIQFQNVAQIRRSSKLNIINSFFTGFPNGIFWDSGKGNTVASLNDGGAADGTNAYSVVKNNVLAGVKNWGGNGFGSKANFEEISLVSGLPFQVPVTTGSATLGNADHTIVPIGHWASAGPTAFSSNKFTDVAADSIYINPSHNNINGGTLHPLKYLASLNTVVARWDDASVGIDATVFTPAAGATFTVSSGILTSGADFTGFTTGNGAHDLKAVNYKGAFSTTDWTAGWVNWNPLTTDYSK